MPPVRHVEVARELRGWARVVRELRARLTWRSGLLTIAGSLILAAVARQVLPDEPPIPAPSSVRSADAGPVGWSSAHGDVAATRTTTAGSRIGAAVAWTATFPAPVAAQAIADEHAIDPTSHQ